MEATLDPCVSRYRELRNLRLVGRDLGMAWQTVYVRLRKAGEPVIGDKSLYGAEADRLGARGEEWFQKIIPHAVNQNRLGFQAKCDFRVGSRLVEVKTARHRITKRDVYQWVFSVRKQQHYADAFVCIALKRKPDGDHAVYAVLVIPAGEVRASTINLSWCGEFRGKWARYTVTPDQLRAAFPPELF